MRDIAPVKRNEISGHIVHASYLVHKELGPGLLESVYEKALIYELGQLGLHVRSQLPIDVTYQGVTLGLGFRMDILVENQVVVEVKAVASLMDVHIAQLLTYLRLTELNLGLLINFNAPVIKDGIRRVVNDH